MTTRRRGRSARRRDCQRSATSTPTTVDSGRVSTRRCLRKLPYDANGTAPAGSNPAAEQSVPVRRTYGLLVRQRRQLESAGRRGRRACHEYTYDLPQPVDAAVELVPAARAPRADVCLRTSSIGGLPRAWTPRARAASRPPRRVSSTTRARLADFNAAGQSRGALSVWRPLDHMLALSPRRRHGLYSDRPVGTCETSRMPRAIVDHSSTTVSGDSVRDESVAGDRSSTPAASGSPSWVGTTTVPLLRPAARPLRHEDPLISPPGHQPLTATSAMSQRIIGTRWGDEFAPSIILRNDLTRQAPRLRQFRLRCGSGRVVHQSHPNRARLAALQGAAQASSLCEPRLPGRFVAALKLVAAVLPGVPADILRHEPEKAGVACCESVACWRI